MVFNLKCPSGKFIDNGSDDCIPALGRHIDTRTIFETRILAKFEVLVFILLKM